MITGLFRIVLLSGGLLCAAPPLLGLDTPSSTAPPGAAGTKQQPDLTQLGIEDLMKIQVTSVSKTAEPLSSVAAAVYVITQEDIRRSGATSVPEALRMVPGVQVAQISATEWAISIRGFNSVFADKLLVLVDGRSIYTPLYSGVLWGIENILLPDVDRIEVIRGPGGSLWGANAVNGIINIITKKASETQGTLVSGMGGAEQMAEGMFRHGGRMGKDATFRVYGRIFSVDDTRTNTGESAGDQWSAGHGGFRMDWDRTRSGAYMVEGDLYYDRTHIPETTVLLTPPYSGTFNADSPTTAGHLLGRWESAGKHAQTTVQTYYDYIRSTSPASSLTQNTVDLDLQQHLLLGSRHSFTWGGGYRTTQIQTQGSAAVAFSPATQTLQLFSAFVHDEIRLRDDLHLTLGTKVEHNDFTGFEVQPNARIAYTPDERHTLWGAISRAVRTPGVADRSVQATLAAIPPGQNSPVTLVTLVGNPAFVSESVVAYEAGYRLEATSRWLLDLAAFYNVYDHLRGGQPLQPFFSPTPVPHAVAPIEFANNSHATTAGVEISSRWTPTANWQVTLGYSHLDSHLRSSGQVFDIIGAPDNQAQLLSHWTLPHQFEIDSALYYVDRVRDLGVPAYARMDVRLGWHSHHGLEISAGVQNLLNSRHVEFENQTETAASRVQRSVYGKATWHF